MSRESLLGGMGFVHIDIEVQRDVNGPATKVTLLVDTGASIGMIPRPVLEALGITPIRRQNVELADGRLVPRDIGGAILRYEGVPSVAEVIFGEEGDAAILGVITLEQLGLTVDPRTGRLARVGLMVIRTKVAVPA